MAGCRGGSISRHWCTALRVLSLVLRLRPEVRRQEARLDTRLEMERRIERRPDRSEARISSWSFHSTRRRGGVPRLPSGVRSSCAAPLRGVAGPRNEGCEPMRLSSASGLLPVMYASCKRRRRNCCCTLLAAEYCFRSSRDLRSFRAFSTRSSRRSASGCTASMLAFGSPARRLVRAWSRSWCSSAPADRDIRRADRNGRASSLEMRA